MKKFLGIAGAVLVAIMMFAGSMSTASATEENECYEGMFAHSSWLADDFATIAEQRYVESGVITPAPLEYMNCTELTVVFSGWSVAGVTWQPWLGRDGVVTALRADLESAYTEHVTVNVRLVPTQIELLQAMLWYDAMMGRETNYKARVEMVITETTSYGVSYDIYLDFVGFFDEVPFIPEAVWSTMHADQ